MVLIKKYFLQKSMTKVKVDEYLAKQFYNAEYAGVDIIKTPIGTRVVIYAGRPAFIIGKQGKTIKQLAQILERLFGLENPQITVTTVENPELNARVMAFRLAIALEKGYHFRRAAFITIRRIMKAGAYGAEVVVSGKLTSERAKYEKLKEGIVYKSGQQLERIVDRAIAIAMLKPGVYGVEVIITKPMKSVDKIELREKPKGGEEINKIEKKGDIFLVKGIKGEYIAKTLILAFGKTPRELQVKGEQEFKGKGVSYCAICDAAFFKGKPAAVVGEGEPGLEAIELLSRYAKPAYYISRSTVLVGSDENLVKGVLSNNNIKLYLGYTVKEIQGDQKVSRIVISNLKDGKTEVLEVEGVIIEMGYELRTDFVKDLVKLNDKGEIIVDELGKTSMEGVFAAGDVTSTPYKQAVVAAAEGVKAALSAYNYLRSKSGLPPVNVDWKAEKKKFSMQLRL